MAGGRSVLCVGYGLVDTVAVLVDRDGGWLPLRFDGAEVLSSAVFLNPDGTWLAGAAAWRAGEVTPERLEAAPARWLAAGQAATVAGGQVAVWDMVAATLRLVAQTAQAFTGDAVGEVRLVVPGGWGPRRRAGMRQAAWQAGLGQPELIAVGEAVAAYTAVQARWMVGSFVGVLVLDGGAEASVVRRTALGFETLSLVDAPEGGAMGWDAAVAELLPAPVQGPGWPGGWVGQWEAASAARRAAATAPAVTVPGPAGPVVLAAATVHAAGEAMIGRAGQVLMQAVEAAELPPPGPAAVLVAGELATTSTAAALTAATGLPVVPVEQSRWAGVLGAARVTGPPTDTTTSGGEELPAGARAVAPAVAWVGSLVLFIHFLTSAYRQHPVGQTYVGAGYLVATWGELALATVFALVGTLTAATLFASLLPDQDPFDHPSADKGAGVSWWDSQQIGPALVAAAAVGVGVAGLYAMIGSVLLSWGSGPFLRWALIPQAAIIVWVLLAAVLATRGARTPARGWYRWLGFPIWSVFVTVIGMVMAQLSYSAPIPHGPRGTVLTVFGQVGGGLIGIGAAIAVADRRRWRLILSIPLGLVFAAASSFTNITVLVCLYVAAVSLWWAQRVWVLANRAPVTSRRPT